MLLPRTNIESKLRQLRDSNYTSSDILQQVRNVLEADHFRESEISKKLAESHHGERNAFNLDLLETHRIYHIDQIKKICIDYRLRFLDTKYFKGSYPQKAISEIKYLENKHHISLNGFKIMAPSKLFVLAKADDPLLMAPIGNDYYYLVATWGKDLHPLRKLWMWFFKSFENLAVGVLLLSVLATLLVPDGLFTKEATLSQDIMVFFFMFKSIAAVVIFYGFALGKNFNTAIWNSKYDKSR